MTLLLRSLLSDAEHALNPHSDSPRLDAELLLAAALGKPRSYLLAHATDPVDESLRRHLDSLLKRRQAGEPVAYILGEKEFWSLTLRVTADTLVPRPDTERLVEIALQDIDRLGARQIADLGTGSGAIALAIAHERPGCSVTATDISAAALDVATGNAKALGIGNVEFVASDWSAALPRQTFELVVSNPPYVAAGDVALERLGAEPRSALASGPEGLDDIVRLATEVPSLLKPGGRLLVEHGFGQADAVRKILEQAGWQAVENWRDYAGHPRVTGATWP